MWRPRAGLIRSPARILFGQMYEDSAIEMRAFRPGSRVFCIASAGDTAIALARDHNVTAVDINPAQLEYARKRASAGLGVAAAAERARGLGLSLMYLAGWTPARMRHFLNLGSCEAQLHFWRTRMNTVRFRVLFDTVIAISLSLVRRLSPDRLSLPGRGFGALLRLRVERGLARFPNRTNPHAWRLFTTRLSVAQADPGSSIRFECADAADFLLRCPENSFDAFTLSNIADGVTPAYFSRLKQAVRRAASPTATVVLRTFREPDSSAERALAAEDRSMIWGGIYSGPVSMF